MPITISSRILLLLWSLVYSVPVSAAVIVIPAERLTDPLNDLTGLYPSVQNKQHDQNSVLPVFGYQVNASTHYFFDGDSSELNEFLKRSISAIDYQRADGFYHEIIPTVTIHVGKSSAVIPGREDELDPNWKLELLADYELKDDRKNVHRTLNFNIRVWVSDRISLNELEIPKIFDVRSGGEIEQFIDRHRKMSLK